MRYLSVCSGIESASVAWGPLGWKAVGFSEIEPFPCSVLQHRYPDVPNYGDMTKFREWNIDPGSIDVLVGGTPCQSFSVAGLRGGIQDDRGNLAITYCRILDRFKPRWFVWENVPGVLSSGGGRDFGSIIGAMVELGYGVAYRILDAQFFGVPQRRRRVFVVGCLGNWRGAAEALFEQGCVRGDTKKGQKKREDVTGSLAARTSAGGGLGTDFDLDGGLQAVGTLKSSHSNSGEASHIIAALTARPYADNSSSESRLVAYQQHGSDVGIMGCLRAGHGDVQSGVPFLADIRNGTLSGTSMTLQWHHSGSSLNTQPVLVVSTGDISHCLNAGGMGRQDYETETMVVAIQERATSDNPNNGPDGIGVRTDGKAYTLEARSTVQAVAFTQNQRNEVRELKVVGALQANPGMKQQAYLSQEVGVRRLTVTECERLQGFPDGHTLVPHRGKPAADGPRYKAIGNSMAVPCMAWLGNRIQMVENRRHS